MSSIEYKFLPWLRTDAATLISTPESLGQNASANYQTQVELKVNQKVITVPVNIYGPGDVLGIENRQILRCEPLAGTVEFEPNYFPLIELREADFPWRFTPTMASSDVPLRPWLTLITLEKQSNPLKQDGNAPLPVVTASLGELPDLAESGLWVHVQLRGPFNGLSNSAEALKQYIRQYPQRAIARIVCCRRLRAQTEYLVCLVPTFEVGRLAGLGQIFNPDTIKLQPAWEFAPQSSEAIDLPVYYSWSFRTGTSTDTSQQFETLARAIKPYPISSAAQPFRVDPVLSRNSDETILHLEGALRPVTAQPSSQDPAPEIQTALKDWINEGARVEEEGGAPQVTPMSYGRWQAGQRKLGTPQTPKWLDELNLDPRHRIAAAAGADLVQKYQDELVSEAWEQAGQLREVNNLLRGAQVAQSAGESLQKRHLESLPPDLLLQVAGPAQQRIRYDDNTLYRTFQNSSLPEEGFEGTFRRVSRTRGPHLRRWGIQQSTETILFEQGLEWVSNLTDEWQWKVVDQGTVGSPSNWSIVGTNQIHQTSRIYSFPTDAASLAKKGTMYLLEHPDFNTYHLADYDFNLTIEAPFNVTNRGSVGVVFRYQDANNYYRFSTDYLRKYRRLVKCVNGQFTLLWEDSSTATVYDVNIKIEGDSIQLYISQHRNDITTVTINDSTHSRGTVGLYTWANDLAKFTLNRFRFVQGITSADFPNQVHDQGNISAPSKWLIDVVSYGAILQRSNIYREPQDRNELAKLGTYITLLREGDPGAQFWRDYVIKVTFFAEDDDVIGVMFRYQDPNNFYRFSMDAQREYQRLVKCENGKFTLLWQRDEGYIVGEEYKKSRVKIIADGSRLWGEMNGRKLFDVRDTSHLTGQAALYTWGNDKAEFSQLQISTLRIEGAMKQVNESLPGKLDFDPLKSKALEGINPHFTVKNRVFERISTEDEVESSQEQLVPLYVTPELNSPLCLRLAEMNPQLILPGIDGVPNDAVSLLETNPAFVASFMVGANHEMSRELLWRGLAADIRATVFRQFWDIRGSSYTDTDDPETYKDILPIHQWNPDKPLSDHIISSSTDTRTILLIRSELIRRFPKGQYYLVKAVSDGKGGRKPGTLAEHISLPQFRGTLSEDTVYFAFKESPEAVQGVQGVQGVQDGLGWYFVIEQEESAVRFGLLDQRETLPPLDWSDLAWSDFDENTTYVHTTALKPESQPTNAQNLIWGKNGAHMAAISQRKPFRIFIHAQQLAAHD